MTNLRVISLSLLICASCLLWAADAPAPQTLRYAILSNGRVAGSEVDTYGPEGRVDSTFEFNDRGRGPKVTVHYILAADGWPARFDATGNDYLKAPVDEHFAVEDGNAHWKSTSEQGQLSGNGFYVSNSGAAAELAFLVAALQKGNGAPIKLLPAGEARLERLTDATVEYQGKKLHVTEFAVTGLSFEAQTEWLDDERRDWASPRKWF